MHMIISGPLRNETGHSHPPKRLDLVLSGAREMLPMVLGTVPFGLAIGAAAGATGMSLAEILAGAGLILAGAAQLSVVQMTEAGASPVVIVLSALMINARLLLYSASLAPWFSHEPLRRRLLLAVPVIDQLYFTCAPKFEEGALDEASRRWFYAGGASFLIGSWMVAQTLAAVAGSTLPAWVGLDLAAPLAMAALLAKAIQGRPALCAALASGVAVLAGVALPFNSAVLVASLVGIGVGTTTTVTKANNSGGAR